MGVRRCWFFAHAKALRREGEEVEVGGWQEKSWRSSVVSFRFTAYRLPIDCRLQTTDYSFRLVAVE